MGMLIAWPHGRASIKVNAERSSSPSSLRKSQKYRLGIRPRLIQLDGAERETPSNVAVDLEPPSASIISLADVSMRSYNPQYVKVSSVHGVEVGTSRIVGHNIPMWTKESVGQNLRLLRHAIGDHSQGEFAQICRLSPTRYNQYETGERMLTHKAAWKIMVVTLVDLNYLYQGKLDGVPYGLAVKLRRLMNAA